MADNGDFDAGLCNICTFHHERLREQYAGMVLQGMFANSHRVPDVQDSVSYADKLIKQLTSDKK
jgi:hypothetical protein